MKKIPCFLFCLIFLMKGQSQKNDATADLTQLRLLNATFIHNFVTNDTASHNRILHKDFTCITGNGQFVGRKEYLDNWAHGFTGYKYWDYRDENISVFGNTALVRSKNKYIVLSDGKELTGMTMYTDIYIKENGQWKCIQAQITRVAPEYYAGDETIVKKYDYRDK